MKNVKKIPVIISSLLLVFFVSIGIFVATAQDRPVWSEVNLEAEYDYNSELEIPARTLTVSGETYNASFLVSFPDGTTSVDAKVRLDQGGTYTIRYYANEGAYYSKEEQFVVFDYLYSFNTTKSEATYEEGKGLSVSLAEGDTLNFNTVIDLSSVTSNDKLFEVVVTPTREGRYDFSRIYFTFTDVLDSSNTMTISLRRSTSTGNTAHIYTYVTAGGENQLLTGLEGVAPPYNIHVEGTDPFGRPVMHSFSNNLLTIDHAGNKVDAYSNPSVSVFYDNSTKELFASNMLIADLDNADYFSTLWSGFKSGKVRLSVYGGLYDSANASFVVKSVYGMDLSAGKIEDNQGPDITIDTRYIDAMPDAAKGSKYNVPSATARDANSGACDVQTMVWFNYNTSNSAMVTVDNGSFSVDRVGTYAIVYTATDKYGNTTIEVLYVLAKDKIDAPEVNLDEISVPEIKLGEKIIPVGYNAVAHSGVVDVSLKIRLGDNYFDIPADGFMPDTAGEYTVEYIATDYIGQTTVKSYTVNVLINEIPQFIDIPDFPLVLIAGSEQSIPSLYVNDYRSGSLNKVLVSPKITDANGTRDVVDNRIVPTVNESGDKIALTYTYEGNTFVKEIAVVSVWGTNDSGRPIIDLQKYLYSAKNDISTEKTEQSIIVTALSSDASLLFANKLPSEKIELIFNSISNKSKYGAVKISLIDAEEQDIAVDIYIINTGKNGAGIKIGDMTSNISSSVSAGSQFTLLYTNKKINIGVSSFDITTTRNGEKFDGFVSDTVYLEMSFVDAENNSAIALQSVNGHAMTNLTSDRTSPKIVVCGEYGGTHFKGDTVTIPACLIGDVLDPNVTASISVTDPNGKIVISSAGVELKKASPYVPNSFVVDTYGQYKVVITAADTFRSNETSLVFVVNVRDELKPTIIFNEEIKSSVKVGETIVLPDFTVSDDISEADDIVVSKFVYTPNGKLIILEGGCNSIVASFEGVYEFRIYVRDAEGNLTFERKTVTVTKGEQ